MSVLPANIDLQLRNVMGRDRYRLTRRWREIQHLPEPKRAPALERWEEQLAQSQRSYQQRQALLPEAISYPNLPVSDKRAEIAELIRDHQVVVLAGETGSGKTTQLPKICLELGRGVSGMIGHTQPRRVAAHTVASRIAQELDSPLGEKVGYQVRFTDKSSEDTLVKVMTDGILLAEIQNDRFLNRYDTLIIDEAHERSLNIDFLLGFLKQLLPKRPDLKLIITSATIDVERFSKHFNDAPIIEVSGRTYDVDVWYRPPETSEGDDDPYRPIVDAIDELQQHERAAKLPRGGDILVFLSGEREIREAAKALRNAQFKNLEIVPFYARLSWAEQQKVFAPHKGRRVVLATNVAETSITVPGIRYVIDPGFARISRYSYRTKVQRLPVEPISQASANQRKGRCGRVSAGICVRLYSEEDFLARPEFTDPEILRTNLAAVILQMLQLRMGDIRKFPFIDPPDNRLINDGFKLLEELHAVTPQQRLTGTGRQLAQLAVDPRLARMLLAAAELGSLREVMIVASALSAQDPRERPADKQQAADQMHRRFWEDHSDFLALVKLWDYFDQQRQELSQNQLRRQCQKEFLNYVRWREWRDVHHQLNLVAKRLNLKQNREPADYETVHRALLTGLLGNVGTHHEEHEYMGVRNRKFSIFPGSSQFKARPKWLMSAELLETSRLFAHTVAKIEPEWVVTAAEHLIKRHHFEPHYDRRSGRVKAYERISLYGLTLVEKQRIDFTDLDPEVCRQVFIRSALVEGRYLRRPSSGRGKNIAQANRPKGGAPKQHHNIPAFFAHNQQLVKELNDLEAKSRRRDILVDDDELYAFYDERIPASVVSRASFDQWRREAERDDERILFVPRERLMQHAAADVTEAQFPDELEWQGMVFPLKYHFEPGHPDDGVSLQVPVSLLHLVPERRLDWLVPGLLRDKCISLIRGLPKSWRRHFVPVPDVVDKALTAMKADNVALTDALGQQMKRQTLVEVPDEVWAEVEVDDFYRFNIQVLDDAGTVIARGRDLPELRTRYRERLQENIQSAASGWEREGIQRWDLETLPETVQLRRAGLQIRAYPALIDQGTEVALQVLDDEREALQKNRRAVARLLLLENPQTVKYLHKELLKDDALALAVAGIGTRTQAVDDLLLASAAHLALDDQPLPRNAEQFAAANARVKSGLTAYAQELSAVLSTSLTDLVAVKKQLKQHRQTLPLAFTLSDINHQLQQLFYPGLVYQTPEQWLRQYPRYLQALMQRLEKAPLNPNKDRQLLEEIRPHWERLEDYLQREGELQMELNDALREYRWAIEELRVSLFAQTLKTRMPVSTKRLNKLWEQVIG